MRSNAGEPHLMERTAEAHKMGQPAPRDRVQGGSRVISTAAHWRQHDVHVASRRQRVQHLLMA